MRISRLGCRRSRDRDRGGPVGTGGHLPGQPCAAGPHRKRLWSGRSPSCWGGDRDLGCSCSAVAACPRALCRPQAGFYKLKLAGSTAWRGHRGERAAFGEHAASPPCTPKAFCAHPTPGWGLLWGAQLLREPGASRRARAGPLGRAPPLPDCCCNDPGGSNEAGNPRACPSPSPAPGQLPQRGSCSSSPWSRPLLSASQRTPFPYPWGAVGVSKMLRVRIAKPGAPPAGSKPAGG